MLTYLLMGLPFIAATLVLDWFVLKTKVIKTKRFAIVLAIMLVLTAVFDQILTGLPIVTYDHAKTLGVKIGSAPIEDFLYTIAAVIGLGSLQKHYDK